MSIFESAVFGFCSILALIGACYSYALILIIVANNKEMKEK